MHLLSRGLSACVLMLLPGVALAGPPDAALAAKAHAILKANCHRCHGQDGAAKGKFGYVLDRDRLIARGKVAPGSPSESELFQRVESGEMPPPGKGPRPGKDEIAVLRRWIEAGAPGTVAVAKREFVPDAAVQRRILDDVQSLNPRHRRFARYFTLTHLANAGLPEKDLQLARQALGKLVNALSWHPRIARPTPIDPGQTVFRIDLRHYKWTAALWDRLATAYPYRLGTGTAEARAVVAATGAELPVLRGDWFVATASRPPLYQDLLQLPGTERALERLLQVDVPLDIKEETAARAGFNDSGVSKNNRLIERHDAAFGAYWRSYDFAENTGRQNLFEHPLGPAGGETSFAHAGGEMIFHLPNGLHGYMLADGTGRRIDKGPVEIVSDPKRPDQRVETGISCMNCHARGLLPKADQVRAHVEKNPNAFAGAVLDEVKALYLPKARLQALLDEDNKRYLAALARTGASADEPEPVNGVTQRYEATLDGRAAAAELGLAPEDFAARLKQAPALARAVGALRLKSGTVQRQVFEESFVEIARAFRLDDAVVGAATTLPAAGPKPFSGHKGSVLGVTFAPDGKRAASAGDDRTVRLWDVATGRELRRFDGHTDEVTCVAFTPDGRRLLSGGRDRTVRLWDLGTGKEIRRFAGHTDRVRVVAISPDGSRFASAGDDRTVRVWDLATGAELVCLTGHTRPVSAVAFVPDGRRLLSGGHDGTVRLWDLAGGKELRCFEGQAREVHAVAVSPDGRLGLSGGSDRAVRLWDLEKGTEVRACTGHANAVIAVVFAPDGRHLLSASSRYRGADRVVRRWELATGREVQALAAPEAVRVGCVAFAPDGRSALSGGSDEVMRLWRWDK